MGLIPQAKCSRCDRIYSGLRGRCPYCGARRRKKGKRTEDTDNAKWKLVIGALLIIVLIAAVIVLLINTFTAPETATTPENEQAEQTGQSEGVSSVETDPEPVVEPEPEVEPEPVIVTRAEKITIMYGNKEKTDVTMKVADNVQFKYATVPEEIENAPLWESSNPDVFVVLQSGLVTAVKPGTATLVVTVDGVSAQCTIRVK